MENTLTKTELEGFIYSLNLMIEGINAQMFDVPIEEAADMLDRATGYAMLMATARIRLHGSN